jgi:hypothetical protein
MLLSFFIVNGRLFRRKFEPQEIDPRGLQPDVVRIVKLRGPSALIEILVANGFGAEYHAQHGRRCGLGPIG